MQIQADWFTRGAIEKRARLPKDKSANHQRMRREYNHDESFTRRLKKN